MIKDWSLSAPNSHIAGGMKYQDGKLTVPISGRYYIYAQIYYHNNGRVHVRVNNKIITMTQPLLKPGNSEFALYAGGVFNLKAGDAITLDPGAWPTSSVKVHLSTVHSYFGAFFIWPSQSLHDDKQTSQLQLHLNLYNKNKGLKGAMGNKALEWLCWWFRTLFC